MLTVLIRLKPTYEPTIPWDSRYATPSSSPTVLGGGGVGDSSDSFPVGDGESSSSSVGDGGSLSSPPPLPADGTPPFVLPEKPPQYHPGAVFVPNTEGRVKYSGPGAIDTIVVLRLPVLQEDRLMQDWEIEKYCDVVFEFLKSLPDLDRANIHVLNVEVHFQESIFSKIDKKKNHPEKIVKGIRGLVDAAADRPANVTGAPNEMPPAYLEVTTIITTINSILSPAVTGFFIMFEIESNAAVLAEDLSKALVFLEVNMVSGRLIDRATGESLLGSKPPQMLVLCLP